MRKIFVCLILYTIICSDNAKCQDFCGTPDTGVNILDQIPKDQLLSPSNEYVVRVFIHIIRRTNGTGGQNIASVTDALNLLVNDFEPHGICISLLGVGEILNDTYYGMNVFNLVSDANSDGKFDNFSPNSHQNAIDIYLFPSDNNFGGGVASKIVGTAVALGGYYFDTNWAISHYLSHEVGHCLGLYHTFRGMRHSNGTVICEQGCQELVDGTNCDICGDFVCDTPADPQSYGHAHGTCTWNGISCANETPVVDPNGATYNPAMNLIMAYLRPQCMTMFTSGQGERMRQIIANSTLLQSVIVPNSLTISNLNVNQGAKFYDVLDALVLQTNVAVQSGAALTVRAGQSITINSLFQAHSSASFLAYIDLNCSTVEDENSAKMILAKNKENEQSFESIRQDQSSLNIKIHPNPTSGSFINLLVNNVESDFVKVIIMASTGIVIKVLKLPITYKEGLSVKLNVSDFNTGIYFIRVEDGNRSVGLPFILVK